MEVDGYFFPVGGLIRGRLFRKLGLMWLCRLQLIRFAIGLQTDSLMKIFFYLWLFFLYVSW